MLDIKFIRENPNKLKEALQKRRVEFKVEKLLAVDELRRKKIREVDELRAKLNEISKDVGRAEGNERENKIAHSRKIKEDLAAGEDELKKLEEEFNRLMYQLPNIPAGDVPVGQDERDNKVIREEGEKPKFSFKPRDYIEIAAQLDLIDTKRAAKVSGSRFGYLKREAVLLEFALVRFAFNHLSKNGFIPIVPPVLIKEEMMRGMGYIDSEKDREERYFLEKDGLFLVGTSEQSVGPMHANEIFKESDLPRRYVAFSSCFRREAGSYGKDTHGILRVHQFDKVEMFTFSKPEDSKKEHKLMLRMEEELMQALKIPYRVVQLCTGDLAQPSASTYDIEAWLPGQNDGKGQYRETHSTSNTTDFQARRLNIRYRPTNSRLHATSYVHMLNGTAFAIGRMLIAIIENYQQEDGSVYIPEALRPYVGLEKIQRKRELNSTLKES